MTYLRSSFSHYQQECDNYLNRSLNHEMYLRKVKKSILSEIDDKRYYENNVKSKSWN